MDTMSTYKNFEKYRYIYNGRPEVPETWTPIILDMLKQLDKVFRPKYIPIYILNLAHDSDNKLMKSYLNKLIGNFKIDVIKQKFARLSVYGKYDKVEDIISNTVMLCNDTCEFCGKRHTQNVVIKNWVRNLCNECKVKHKNNGADIRDNTTNQKC